ncbi:glycine-rich RNA-binding protein GRP2A-like [Eutrema salsugineum]|uniref:glycine-rich RNA-binding protein GRP2A-like n=1 Tax=Eutrema salsugineum TaxID=72664 RepID=UPI000CED65BA|nr:glycine-rich RNA-binding protein GRP2A-like [Eutrema salsugineum]
MASEDVEYKCYVRKNAFSRFGDVIGTYVVYPSEYDEDHSMAYGFVTFKDEKSMRDAINGMNGTHKLAPPYTTITVEQAYSSRKSCRRHGVGPKKKKA